MADVDRPRCRQRNPFEHPSPPPIAPLSLPERWVSDSFRLYPCPVLRRPPSRVSVAAGLDEFQKAGIGDVMTLDGKRRHLAGTRRELVVPSKRNGGAIDAERHAAARGSRPTRRQVQFRAMAQLIVSRLPLLVERQAMPHVQQRLLMHRLVFENREDRFGAVEERISGPIDVGMKRARR